MGGSIISKCLRMLTVGLVGGLKTRKCLWMLTLGSVGGLKNSEMLTDTYGGVGG